MPVNAGSDSGFKLAKTIQKLSFITVLKYKEKHLQITFKYLREDSSASSAHICSHVQAELQGPESPICPEHLPAQHAAFAQNSHSSKVMRCDSRTPLFK